ncbi:MAG: DNA polymerase III subunit [Candidatus Methylomirabilia bacterium]
MIFANLVGHRRAKEALSSALARSSVHTRYLFAGPAGVGKHLAAAEFVRAWLCSETGTRNAPCGLCDSCVDLKKPTPQDLVEVTFIDNKKSIGVDQVRALESWLAASPALGRHKAAIVDPAGALTSQAANALLKTLEEPPPGRVIVLVATRPGALPPTVRSRCQLVSFGSLSDDEVVEVLRRSGWPALTSRQAAALAEGSPGAALERDGRLWRETADAVRALFDALAAGERGAALSFAEGTGDSRERALAALQSIIGFSRLAARQRLGDGGLGPEAVPPLLMRMESDQVGRLLAGALEAHRRLEGDRPPNAKLALAVLLAGASDAGVRQ